MSSIAPQQLVTTALLGMLRSSLPGFQIGDHTIPPSTTTPYAILYQIEDQVGFYGPVLVAPDADTMVAFQVTSVGARRDQAQWFADKVRESALGRDGLGHFLFDLPAIPGWVVADRVSAGAASGVQVEGTEPNRLYQVNDRYMLYVTPA